MTSHRIGVNLRVSGNCDQGGRKYMEDNHAIKFVKKDTRDYEFAYFGIFDGHGGPEASRFARDKLLGEITKYDQFWSDNDDDVLFAIKSGFLDTHQAMWKELDNWPRTVSGLPSTSGTTASVAIVKKGKLYIGHVGDSGIVLGCDEGPRNAVYMKPKCLTKDHKPDNPEERARIEKSGGSVVAKAGVQRVVWSRPKVNHKGPVRRSTQIDKIPFLAVARSLGDLWSYDYYKGQFVVSPEPDVSVMALEPGRHRCLVLASDGLWNMLSASESVSVVTDLEMHFEDRVIHDPMVSVSYWINPAERLVTRALNKWRAKSMKADNVSCVVVLIDPLGPSKLTILRKRREEHFRKMHEARKAAVAAKLNNTSSGSDSTSTSASVNTNAKVNRNQSNSGSDGEDSGDTDENGAKKDTDLENNLQTSCSGHGVGVGMSSSTGLATNDSNHNVNNGSGGGGHTVDDSMLSIHYSTKTVSRVLPRPASASKVSKTHRPPLYRATTSRFSLPGRSALDSEMDDSVQAASDLTVSPCFNLPLSPTLESPLLSSPAETGKTQRSDPARLSFSMSDSLLKLMNLDAVKASSDPVIKPEGHTVGLTPANCVTKTEVVGSKGVQDEKVCPSQLFSKSVLHSASQSRPEPLGMKTSHSSDRLSLQLNKTFHSTRVLRVATVQRDGKQDSGKPPVLGSHDHGQHVDDVQPAKVTGVSRESSSGKKVKKKREFGFLYRTRSTLLRAKRAARKAFCPENRPFLKQLPGAKRKRDEKQPPPGTPSSKRLRRSDGLRYSL